MDKSDIPNDKNERIEVHVLPANIREIHRRYGLCILGGSVNHAPVNGFYHSGKRRFEFYSLSHLLQGQGFLELNQENGRPINEGDAVLIAPGDINRYGGYNNQPYVEQAIRFHGNVADMLRNAGVISSGIFHLGKIRLLAPIIELAADPADSSQINANIALQQLLIDLYNQRQAATSINDDVQELISKIKTHPELWWSVEDMAEQVHLSPNQLRRHFLKQTGMLPKEYIEQVKLRYAAELLRRNDHSNLAAIARKAGYIDEYHFSRRFKHFFGIAPGRYRAWSE